MFPDTEVAETKGFITKYVRESEHMDKSHINDALCITGHPKAKRSETRYLVKPLRSHDRQTHKANCVKLTPKILEGLSEKDRERALKKGYRKPDHGPKKRFGYQLRDRVRMPDGREGFVTRLRATGSFSVAALDGEELTGGISYKKLIPLDKRNSILVQAV
jgi:N6-L-threonylcarbamoyladenine synthase